MPRDFLSYWKPETADRSLDVGGTLGHIASNQYSRVEAGDTVWLVTVQAGELYLLGRVLVGQVTTQDEASRLLGTSDLWESSVHILASEGTDETIQDLPITHLAVALRFAKVRLAGIGSMPPTAL